jgi:hypothetical protein
VVGLVNLLNLKSYHDSVMQRLVLPPLKKRDERDRREREEVEREERELIAQFTAETRAIEAAEVDLGEEITPVY